MRDLLVTQKANVLNPNTVSFETREKQLEQEEKNNFEKMLKSTKSPYQNWTQTNNEYLPVLFCLSSVDQKAFTVLLFLLNEMSDFNVVNVKYDVIQKVCGMGRTTVSKSIRQLKDFGLVYVEKHGSASAYIVSNKVFWKTYQSKLIYCKFPIDIYPQVPDKYAYLLSALKSVKRTINIGLKK